MGFIKKLFQPKKCAMCGKKPTNPTYYYNDDDEKVPVCDKCVTYAERRAYRKV